MDFSIIWTHFTVKCGENLVKQLIATTYYNCMPHTNFGFPPPIQDAATFHSARHSLTGQMKHEP